MNMHLSKKALEHDIIFCFWYFSHGLKSSSSVTVFILALPNDFWMKHNFINDAKFDMIWY